MRLRFVHVVAALALLGFVGPQARAVDIYVLSGSAEGYNNNITGFGKIDSATGTYTEITAAVSGSNLVGNLAWNAANSAFYVTENLGSNENLRTLSVSGTLSNQIGSIGTLIYGMAYRPADSKLYAYAGGDLSNNKTGTISTANGTWSDLNSSSGIRATGPVGGRYVLLNDAIYASVNNLHIAGQFGTFGFTGSSTFSQIGTYNDLYNNMVLASDGALLYGVFGNPYNGNQKLYSINPITGVPTFMTNVTGSGLGNFFYGAGIATAVPEPSTYALATIATGVMAFVARRRRCRKA